MRRSAAGGRGRASDKESARRDAHSARSDPRRVWLSISASLTTPRSERSSLRSCGSRKGLRSERLAARSPQVVAPRAGALHRLAAPDNSRQGVLLRIRLTRHIDGHGYAGSPPNRSAAWCATSAVSRWGRGRHLTIRCCCRGGRPPYRGHGSALAAPQLSSSVMWTPGCSHS
jgi:hypothetical protein